MPTPPEVNHTPAAPASVRPRAATRPHVQACAARQISQRYAANHRRSLNAAINLRSLLVAMHFRTLLSPQNTRSLLPTMQLHSLLQTMQLSSLLRTMQLHSLPAAIHLRSRLSAKHLRRQRTPQRIHPLLAIVCALLIHGCASTAPTPLERDLPSNFPNHSVQQILLNVLRAYPDSLYSYRAKASLAIRTPDQSGQFSADMRKSAGDSLYVSISPGLGIEAARALVTPDSFYFYDRLKNRLVYGSMDEAADFLPQPFASKGLFENLLGLISPPPDIEWRMHADSASYYLIAPDGLQTYAIDPAFWRVIQYAATEEDGTLLEQRSFSEFDTFGGLVLPRRVEFNRPQEESRASIYYRSLSLNPDEMSLDIDVRDSAERIQASREP